MQGVIVLTRQEFIKKLGNFWYYYKIHTIAGVVAVIFIIYCLTLFIKPSNVDIKVIFITQKTALSSSQQDDLKKLLTPYTPDRNNDGEKTVSLEQFTLINTIDNTTIKTKFNSVTSQEGSYVILADKDTFDNLVKSVVPTNKPVSFKDMPSLKKTKYNGYLLAVDTDSSDTTAAAQFINNLKDDKKQ